MYWLYQLGFFSSINFCSVYRERNAHALMVQVSVKNAGHPVYPVSVSTQVFIFPLHIVRMSGNVVHVLYITVKIKPSVLVLVVLNAFPAATFGKAGKRDRPKISSTDKAQGKKCPGTTTNSYYRRPVCLCTRGGDSDVLMGPLQPVQKNAPVSALEFSTIATDTAQGKKCLITTTNSYYCSPVCLCTRGGNSDVLIWPLLPVQKNAPVSALEFFSM